MHRNVFTSLAGVVVAVRAALAPSLLATLVALVGPPAAGAQGAAGPPVVEEYYLTDLVGSVRVVAAPEGGLLRRHDFQPFGEEAVTGCGSLADPQLYAGKPRDGETCLDALGARYYQPALGRLHAVDPVLQVETALGNPQQWNRYAYALNNPYRFVDPDGRNPAALALLAGAVLRMANSPAGMRAQQAVAQQGTAAWNALTRFFNSPLGQELTQTGLEIATGGTAGPVGSMAGAGRAATESAGEAFHYTFSRFVASIERQGLRAGSYVTPTGSLSPLQAQIDLALPPNRGLPNALLRVDLDGMRRAGYKIPEFNRVGRSFNMPGGGWELKFPYPVPPEFVTVLRP